MQVTEEQAEEWRGKLLRHTVARKETFELWNPKYGDEDDDGGEEESQEKAPRSSFMTMSKGLKKEEVLAQIKKLQGRFRKNNIACLVVVVSFVYINILYDNKNLSYI